MKNLVVPVVSSTRRQEKCFFWKYNLILNGIEYSLEWKWILEKEGEKNNLFTDPSVSGGENYWSESEYGVEWYGSEREYAP